MEKIVVLGGGSWGTALARVLANKGHDVLMWLRDEEQVNKINKDRENKKYLPGIILPDNLVCTADLDIFNGVKVIISAVPTQASRGIFKRIKNKVEDDSIIVNVSKGLEIGTLSRISEIANEELPDCKYVVLSGPSHAEEVGLDMPTAVVVSSIEREIAEYIQDIFMTRRFRVYTNPDVIGVEISGALKNIIALAAGISDGFGYQDNTKAALMSRGFIEITKLGLKLGASVYTFSGLAGMGDLIVTCTSMHSRNRRAGMLLGEGYSVEEAIDKIGMVVEGMKTVKAAYDLSIKYDVDMPITKELNNIIFNNGGVEEALDSLMTRSKKNEIEEILSVDW